MSWCFIGRKVHGLVATARLEVLLMHRGFLVHAVLVLQLDAQLVLIGILLVYALGDRNKGLFTKARTIQPRQHVARRSLRLAVLAAIC